MGSVNTYLIYVMILFAFAAYNQISKFGKVHISFHAADKSVKEGWVKKNAKFAIFDGGLYYILPNRIASIWKRNLFILPYKADHVDLRFDSPFPQDPEEFTYTAGTPSALMALGKEKEIIDYNHANETVSNDKKKGFFERILPFVMIIGLVIIGYLVWKMSSQIQMLGNGQNFIESQLGQLTGK